MRVIGHAGSEEAVLCDTGLQSLFRRRALAEEAAMHARMNATAGRSEFLKSYVYEAFLGTCRYNYACTCAQALACGAIPAAEVAAAQQQVASTLQGLLSLGTATGEQIAGDADFAGVREQLWFAALLQ